MSLIRAFRIRMGCTCGGWACMLDSLVGCRVKAICEAHDRNITDK